MRRSGVAEGDRIAIISENEASAVVAIFAAWRVGAWPVPLNARYSERELTTIVEHADPRLVLMTSAGRRLHGEQRSLHTQTWGPFKFAVSLRGATPWVADLPARTDERDRVVLMLYTSGTTGAPKGVMIPYRALRYMADLWSYRPAEAGDRVYQVLPISHSYGLCSYLFGALNQGCEVELVSRFDPSDLNRAFREGVALFQGVPAMYARYLEHLTETGLAHEAPRLKAISTGGAPLDPDLKARVEQVFRLELRQAYGLTEAGPTVTVPDSQPQPATALGRPGPDAEVRILDDAGSDAGDGPGEMWVRTPGVMRGYFRDEEGTRNVLTPDGWLKTGDIVRRAADGVLHITGRAKDIIIRSGFNVYPAEVEAVLLSHPDVGAAGVVGRASSHGDECVVAFIQLAKGAQVDASDIAEFAAARLTGYKRPSEIRILSELPLGLSGKVATSVLRELAQQ
jgi:acyl-CoA synthetase (AMP-forming)/AMP-acid ligase II